MILVAVAVCLLAVGAAVITGASVLVVRGYLVGRADQRLRAYTHDLTRHPFDINPLGGLSPGTPVPGASAFTIEVRGPGGQLVLRAGPGSRPAPVLPPVAARAGQLVTATAAGRGSWRVITEPVHYQARRILFAYSPQDFSLLVSGHGRAGPAGTLVVGVDLASVGRAVGRLVMTGLAVSGAAVLAVACLGVLLIRGIRRPAVQAEQAGEHPGQALGNTLRDLRAPLSVVNGLARDYRRRGPRSAGDADRMVARVADEAQRMQALLADLPLLGDEPEAEPHPGEQQPRWPAGTD